MGAIKLIVGLANPGPEYQLTRHNAGEWFIQSLAATYGAVLKPETKFHGYTTEILIHSHKYRLLIPSTFMNLSGKSVAALANFYKIPVTEILVAHDELDLTPGIVKIKKGGGHGGHNGLKDIVSRLANQNDFYRLRIGIGHPGNKQQVISWVLGKASATDQIRINAAIEEATRCFDILTTDGLAIAQQRLHSFKAS